MFKQFRKIRKLVKEKKYDAALSLLLNKSNKKISNVFTEYKVDAWYYIGDIYYRKGGLSKAIEAFKKSFNNNKTDYEIYWYIGNCYFDLKKPKLAERYFRKALDLSKNNYELVNWIGNSLYEQKKYDEAITIYNKLIKKLSVDSALYKVVKTNRDYAVIYQNISLIKNFIKHKKLDKALSLILDKSSEYLINHQEKYLIYTNMTNGLHGII